MNFDQLAQPIGGTLSCRIFENMHIGLRPTLFFDIEVKLQPFDFEGQRQTTSVRLDFIDFKVKNVDELGGRSFSFPVSPQEGFIDGSIYLADAHNPADVTKIAFEELGESSVVTEISIAFDFDYEGIAGALGTPSVHWRVPLSFERARLDEVFAQAHSSIWT